MRRYFYNSLASYLSLYIRPENTVVEIAPRSEGLGARFAGYRAVSSVAPLKKAQPRTPDYLLLKCCNDRSGCCLFITVCCGTAGAVDRRNRDVQRVRARAVCFNRFSARNCLAQEMPSQLIWKKLRNGFASKATCSSILTSRIIA
jgi:hypothetical protein